MPSLGVRHNLTQTATTPPESAQRSTPPSTLASASAMSAAHREKSARAARFRANSGLGTGLALSGIVQVVKILVGLDGSPRQPAVLAAAADLALRYGAQLILLRAIGIPPEMPAEAWQQPGMTLERFLQEKARDSLQVALKTLPDALQPLAQMDTLLATPWEGVCATAERTKADLIVIGSHGYSGLDRVLGTTAARVVNHAKCSVLVVRSAPLAESSGSHAV